MAQPLLRDDVFSGCYGNPNCLNCNRPFGKHTGSGSGNTRRCPRFTVPPSVREKWASLGPRQPRIASHDPACPAACCIHS